MIAVASMQEVVVYECKVPNKCKALTGKKFDVLDKGSLKEGDRLREVVAPVSQVSACQGWCLLKGKCVYFIQLWTNSSIFNIHLSTGRPLGHF